MAIWYKANKDKVWNCLKDGEEVFQILKGVLGLNAGGFIDINDRALPVLQTIKLMNHTLTDAVETLKTTELCFITDNETLEFQVQRLRCVYDMIKEESGTIDPTSAMNGIAEVCGNLFLIFDKIIKRSKNADRK